MTGADDAVRLVNVSKFYGEVLGVNRVDLELPDGVTGLVGPNGAGKSTLMNLLAGLLRPTRGRVSVHGATPADPRSFYRLVGYCPQPDAFPPGVTGRGFLESCLRVRGLPKAAARECAERALAHVGLASVGDRPVAAYSKGMRQRVKVAFAICHEPALLILDEPLNGLDPQARAEVVALFRGLCDAGARVLISSHVLPEIEGLADQVIFLDAGYLVASTADTHADAKSRDASAARDQPLTRLFLGVANAGATAGRLFQEGVLVEARIESADGLLVAVRDLERFHQTFHKLVVDEGWRVHAVRPAEDAVAAAYRDVVRGGEGR